MDFFKSAYSISELAIFTRKNASFKKRFFILFAINVEFSK